MRKKQFRFVKNFDDDHWVYRTEMRVRGVFRWGPWRFVGDSSNRDEKKAQATYMLCVANGGLKVIIAEQAI